MVFKPWFCRQVDLPALVKHGEAGLDRGISTAGAAPVFVLLRVHKFFKKYSNFFKPRYAIGVTFTYFLIELAHLLQRKHL
jgi:hypothetical protein